MKDPSGSASKGAGQEDMLVAGDVRPEFKEKVAAIVAAVGFRPRFVGPIRYARNLEAIAELWIHLAVPPAGETRENWGRSWNFAVHGLD
jgi:predicted dinucleotide-binding enzyme